MLYSLEIWGLALGEIIQFRLRSPPTGGLTALPDALRGSSEPLILVNRQEDVNDVVLNCKSLVRCQVVPGAHRGVSPPNFDSHCEINFSHSSRGPGCGEFESLAHEGWISGGHIHHPFTNIP